MKEVKKRMGKHSKTRFDLTIINSIKNYNKLPSYKVLGISKQTLNYHVRKLKTKELIRKISYGTWELTNKKEVKKKPKVPYVAQQVKKNIRSHAFVFSVKIPKIKRWKDREIYFKKKNIEYINIRVGQRLNLNLENKKFKVWVCNKSIVIYFDKGIQYTTETAKEGYLRALYDVKRIIIRLENMLNISFKTGKNWLIRVSRQHYGKTKDSLAKHYLSDNSKMFVRDEFNKVWLVIDNSYNLKEIETISSKNAVSDMDKVVKPLLKDIGEDRVPEYFNEYKNDTDNKLLMPSQISNIVGQLANLVTGVAENQVMFDKNFQSHLKVIGDLGKAVNELRKEVKRLNK